MRRSFSIRRTDDIEAVEELHRRCFQEDTSLDGDVYWLVWEKGKDYPVGFATARESTVEGCGFLARAGVLEEAQGQGLQRRLIRTRVRWARDQGYEHAITYVANWNTPSLINLLKEGFTIYDPQYQTKGGRWRLEKRDGFVYLSRPLKKSED